MILTYRKEGVLCGFFRPQVDRELGHFLRFLKEAKYLNGAGDYQHLTKRNENNLNFLHR